MLLQIARAPAVLKVRVVYSPRLQINFESLFELSSVIITTAYRWLTNSVVAAAARVESDLVRELYTYIRSVVSPALLRSFWFVTANDEQAFYVFDEERARLALATASDDAPRVSRRPVSLVAEMFSGRIPYSDSMSREALEARTGIRFEPLQTKYRATMAGYVAAQRVVNRADVITLVPLVQDGRVRLLAAFPASIQSDLQPIIEAHRQEIARRFKCHRQSMSQLLATVSRTLRSIPTGPAGELIGGIIKALGS